MSDVHYCDREVMDLEKAYALRKQFVQCNTYYGECDGNCEICQYNFSMADYHKAEEYVWQLIGLIVEHRAVEEYVNEA